MSDRTEWPEDPELRAKLVALLRYEQFAVTDASSPEDAAYRKGWNARAESIALRLESREPFQSREHWTKR